jgi:hypothetical protein
LQAGKQEKAWKTQKKVLNIFRGTHVFLQNGPIFGAKTGLEKTRRMQVAAAVRVGAAEKQAKISENQSQAAISASWRISYARAVPCVQWFRSNLIEY